MSVKFKSLLSIPRSRHFHLSPNPNISLHFLSTSTTPSPPPPTPTPTPDPELINKLCRILSDYHAPHADLSTALSPFPALLSPAAAAAVLRRCLHLPIPCLRFFRFTSSLEGFHHDPSSISVLAVSLAAARQFPLLHSLLSDLSSSHITPALFALLFPVLACPMMLSVCLILWPDLDLLHLSQICTSCCLHFVDMVLLFTRKNYFAKWYPNSPSR